MKYGVIVCKNTYNIGDDIQSYAAIRLLPSVDYYIERENLDGFISKDKEPVSVIINGWLMNNKLGWPVSYYINPLYTSLHFQQKDLLKNDDLFLTGFGKKDLLEHAPIGCRDSATMEMLERNGVDAYYSGCLTLTLGVDADVEKKDLICIVDVSEKLKNHVLSVSSGCEIEEIHHEEKDRSMIPWDRRFEETEQLLRKYKSARAVITTRLHCALPCLALGVPVLLVDNDRVFEKDRFSGLKDLLHSCSEEEFIQGKYEFSLIQPPPNGTNWKTLKDGLLKTIADWTVWSEKNEAELYSRIQKQYDLLPERLTWKNECAEELIKRLQNERVENHQWMDKQEEARLWFVSQMEEKDAVIQNQQKELAETKEEISKILETQNGKRSGIQYLKDCIRRLIK